MMRGPCAWGPCARADTVASNTQMNATQVANDGRLVHADNCLDPKSFAAYLSAICPLPAPCVTQELCTLSMLSRKIRARACVRKYSTTPVGCSTFRTVCCG